MQNSKNWYAVYTRPKWEKRVAELLVKKGIENYCPVNKVLRQRSDRKVLLYEPLFTSYVFVHISYAERICTLETDGLLNFVSWLGKPAVIKAEEIDIIKRFLNTHKYVNVEKSELNCRDKIRILNGPLMMKEGEIIEVRNKKVKVSLPSIGYTLVAEVDRDNVEKLEHDTVQL